MGSFHRPDARDFPLQTQEERGSQAMQKGLIFRWKRKFEPWMDEKALVSVPRMTSSVDGTSSPRTRFVDSSPLSMIEPRQRGQFPRQTPLERNSMKRPLLLLLLCAWLPACVLFQRPPRPVHASPQEAASFTWPKVLPSEGRQSLSGTTLAIVQMARVTLSHHPAWEVQPGTSDPGPVRLQRRSSAGTGSEALSTGPPSPRGSNVPALP